MTITTTHSIECGCRKWRSRDSAWRFIPYLAFLLHQKRDHGMSLKSYVHSRISISHMRREGKKKTPGTCTRPPGGWFCTREKDHDGACPAWPR